MIAPEVEVKRAHFFSPAQAWALCTEPGQAQACQISPVPALSQSFLLIKMLKFWGGRIAQWIAYDSRRSLDFFQRKFLMS